MRIQVSQSSIPSLEEYVEEIKEIWNNRWLTNMGEKHRELEFNLLEYLNVPNITMFTNGHLALESVLEVFNLTGEVITTPFTFISTTHAIVRNGLKPVFCDINPVDYTIDTDKIENLITEKTSAIVPVHVYGNVCNIEAIDKIAKRYNLKVIYDAAHAFGVAVNGKGIGNFGDASMFSFHATKVFNTIEGGAVTYNDNNIKRKLDLIKNFGISGSENIESIGINAKMSEFHAAMGLCNLKYIDKNITSRKLIVDRYLSKLDNLDGVKLLKRQQNVRSNYSYFPVIFDGYSKNRNEIYDLLIQNNIYSRKYFYPLTNNVECFKYRYNLNDTPIAEHIADRVLCLPLYPELSLEDVDRICEIIKS